MVGGAGHASHAVNDFRKIVHIRSYTPADNGMHLSLGACQAKLIRWGRGRIWDVVVDLRAGSPAHGEWEAFELDVSLTHRRGSEPGDGR